MITIITSTSSSPHWTLIDWPNRSTLNPRNCVGLVLLLSTSNTLERRGRETHLNTLYHGDNLSLITINQLESRKFFFVAHTMLSLPAKKRNPNKVGGRWFYNFSVPQPLKITDESCLPDCWVCEVLTLLPYLPLNQQHTLNSE